MNIYKRKDGRYSAQVKMPEGNYKSIYGKTKKEVRQKANKLIAEIENSGYVKKDNTTFGGYYKRWIKNYKRLAKPNTVRGFEASYRNYFKGHFEKRKLQEISTRDIQDLVSELIDKGLKASSIRTIIKRLQTVLENAVRDEILKDNPAKRVQLPRRKKGVSHALDTAQAKEFIRLAYETWSHGDILEFLILTGLRVCELRGVKISDYDYSNHSLLIERQLDKENNEIATKNNKPRLIILTKRAVEIIEKRIREIEKKRESNPGYDPFDYCFINRKEFPPGVSGILTHVRKIGERLGIEHLKTHDLRHTYATLSLTAGADIKTVQENLGHSSPGFTLDMYASSTTEMKLLANEKLEKLFDD